MDIVKKLEKNFLLSIFLLSFSSVVVSLNFLDPINWPKQIGLVVAASYLLVQSLVIASTRKDTYVLLSIVFLIFSVIVYFIPWLFVHVEIPRLLWGTFGRNNGFVTNICLAALGVAGFVFFRNVFPILTFLRFVSTFSCLSGIYGLIQYFDLDFVSWSKTGEVFSVYGNSNFASAAFCLGASTSICTLWLYRKNLKSFEIYFNVANLSLLTFATIQTNSIQGVLGIAVTFVVLSVLSVRNRSYYAGMTLLGMMTLLSSILILGFYGRGPLGTSIEQYTLILRKEYWLAGIRMGFDHFLWGVGYDSYGDFFQLYRSDLVTQLTSVGLTTNNSHNPFIQLFSTLGLVGSLPLIFSFVTTITVLTLHLFSKKYFFKPTEIAGTTLFVTLWSMAFFSIDNISIVGFNWFVMGMCLGVHLCISQDSKEKNVDNSRNFKSHSDLNVEFRNWTQYRKGIGALLVLIAFGISWSSSSPNRELSRIFTTPVSQNDPQSLDTRQRSLLKVLENPMIRDTEIKWIAEAYYNMGLEDAAKNTLLLGIKRFPRDMVLLDNLGFILEKSQDYESASKIRIRQLEIEARNWRIYYFLALDFEKIGEKDKAVSYLNEIDQLARFMDSSELQEYSEIKKKFGI